MALTPQVYRFSLSDREYRRAWVREYYRRPGSRLLRIVLGPFFAMVGVALVRSTELFTRGMGVATVLLGLWVTLKPLLAANTLVRHRRATGRGDVTFEITLHRQGIRIDDGKVRTELPWDEVISAGRSPDYFWYEVRGGSRATIPLRVVEDPAALEALLRERTTWR